MFLLVAPSMVLTAPACELPQPTVRLREHVAHAAGCWIELPRWQS